MDDRLDKLDESMKSYGNFVVLSKEAEDVIKNMSDKEIDFYANRLHESMENTRFNLLKEQFIKIKKGKE